ncbi:MAG: cytochrome c3 family protein [Gallionella sp.]|nr:cytochrome c3 family protein [Gallionella sp.]
MNVQKIILVLVLLVVVMNFAYAAFLNQGSVANTRHNMTQQTMTPIFSGFGNGSIWMNSTRNDYTEVCVYCHTPHGASTAVSLPLWNRTIKATTYTTYNQLGTSSLTQVVSQPGAASLSCLSCHDGQTAIDSIVNMPGSGLYSAAQMTTQNEAFLNSWTGSKANPGMHSGLNSVDPNLGCLVCHSPAGAQGAWTSTPAYTYLDFTVFALGTDLTNDHPVGVTFPSTSGPGTDFNTPASIQGTTRYFDIDGNGKMGSGDVRLYDTGGAAQVECASCHDPHGVPSAGPGSTFKPSFLRVSNTGSALCLTCHIK